MKYFLLLLLLCCCSCVGNGAIEDFDTKKLDYLYVLDNDYTLDEIRELPKSEALEKLISMAFIAVAEIKLHFNGSDNYVTAISTNTLSRKQEKQSFNFYVKKDSIFIKKYGEDTPHFFFGLLTSYTKDYKEVIVKDLQGAVHVNYKFKKIEYNN
jgi:hypothetical protein